MERDAAAADEAGEKLTGALDVLDDLLAVQPFVAGASFRVADLNVASVLTWAGMVGFDIAAHKHLVSWLDTCLSRPAARKFLVG